MANDLLPDATTEGTVPFRGGQTWYRVTGDLAAAREQGVTPLVVLHGGPGCTHDYVLRIAALAARGRPVVHYDQVGNGRSTHLPGRGADFWTVGLFLDELDAVLAHLAIADRYAVLGQSWGGMLAAEHAVRRPAGLRALVVADSPPSMRLWVEGCNRLRAALPPDVQATLSQHEAAGSIDSPDYQAATRVFYDRHVCRVVPWPEEVARTFAALDDESTVYRTMNGPTEFHVTGTLADWSVLDRLGRVAVPTLVVSGRYDEATPETVQPFVAAVPGAVWEMFEESSHMPHVEETGRFLDVVGRFLDAHL